MKTFKFTFTDGTISESKGNTVGEAFTNAGYSHGASKALDYYEEIK